MLNKPKLILASSSPRRLNLLKSIFIYPDQIISPNINEQRLLKEKPEKMALRLAQAKAFSSLEMLNLNEDAFIITADTIMATKAKIFDKATTNEDVRKYLSFFSGRKIKVHTAVSVAKIKAGNLEKISAKLITSDIKFKRISEEELKNYIEHGSAIGSAGGFSIQGLGETLVQSISGSYSSIVGLPLLQTINLLKGLGFNGSNKSSC
jgi:septum formation protein